MTGKITLAKAVTGQLGRYRGWRLREVKENMRGY